MKIYTIFKSDPPYRDRDLLLIPFIFIIGILGILSLADYQLKIGAAAGCLICFPICFITAAISLAISGIINPQRRIRAFIAGLITPYILLFSLTAMAALMPNTPDYNIITILVVIIFVVMVWWYLLRFPQVNNQKNNVDKYAV